MFHENIYKINKEDLNDIRLTNKLPLKYYDLYSSFKIEKDEYDEQLENVKLTYQPRKLKLFFRNINDTMKYFLSEFRNARDLDTNVLNVICLEIQEFIKLNLINAKQLLVKEKVYDFGKSDKRLYNEDL